MKVYIHVPFCRSKCIYCDFYSTPHLELMESYVEAIGREWLRVAPTGCRSDTIYIGGGTPSSLPTDLLDRLVESIVPTSEIAHLREFTIEANPEDVTEDWAAHIVNHILADRVSMGIQTFDDTLLKFLGRRHSAEQAIRAMTILRDAGIGNLSCDLMYGLPGQTIDGWKSDLDRLLSLRPEHLSAYLLSYEPRTRLGVMLSKGKVEEVSDTLAEEMYRYLCDATREAGYEHYEISNFALPGYKAIHNSSYWDGSEYIGLGPGAHSYAGGVRWFNESNLKRYVESEDDDLRVIEQEDEKNRFNDMLITSLRTSTGLNSDKIPQQFKANFENNISRMMALESIIESPDGSLLIPEEKWLTSNSILLELIVV